MKFCFKIIVQVFAFYRVISIKVNFIFGRKLPDLGDPTKFFSIANLIYPLFAEIPYTLLFFIKCVIFSLSYKQLGSGYLSYIYLYVISFNMYLWLLEDKTNENGKSTDFLVYYTQCDQPSQFKTKLTSVHACIWFLSCAIYQYETNRLFVAEQF